MKVVDLKQDFLFKGLFYGQAGSEKTRLSASAALDPRTAPALMVSAVGNPLSIRDYPQKPTIIELEAYKELTDVYKWLKAGQPQKTPQGTPYTMWANLGKPEEKFRSIILDGLTYLQRWASMEATGNLDIGVGDMPTAMQQQHHGQVLTRMTLLADRFYTLPLHVIVTALEYEQQDSVGNLYYRVQLTGQASGEVPSYAYLVGRLIHRQRVSPRTVGATMSAPIEEAIKKDARATSILLLRPSIRYYAKNQYCLGPALISSPTMTKVLDLVAGKYVPEPDEEDEEEEEEVKVGVNGGERP